MKQLLRTQEAAEHLTNCGFPVARKTLEVWRCQGRGPVFIKIGRRVFYRIEDLTRFLEGIEILVVDPSSQTVRRRKANDVA